MFNRRHVLAAAAGLALPFGVRAQAPLPTVTIGIPNRVGAAPFVLAEQKGLFRKNGVDVVIRIIPHDQREAALASGHVDGVAVTMDSAIQWAAGNRPVTQILLLERSHGGDGLIAQPGTPNLAALKGKRIACDAAGTSQYFFLGYVLHQAGMALGDVTVMSLPPAEAAQALEDGRCQAAVTSGLPLARAHADPKNAAVLTTTLDFPVMVTTLAFPAWFVAAQAVALRGVVSGWFDALALIASDPAPAYAAMGTWMGLDEAGFRAEADLVEWPNRTKTRLIMTGDMPALMKDAAAVEVGAGLIEKVPDLSKLLDTQFVAA